MWNGAQCGKCELSARPSWRPIAWAIFFLWKGEGNSMANARASSLEFVFCACSCSPSQRTDAGKNLVADVRQVECVLGEHLLSYITQKCRHQTRHIVCWMLVKNRELSAAFNATGTLRISHLIKKLMHNMPPRVSSCTRTISRTDKGGSDLGWSALLSDRNGFLPTECIATGFEVRCNDHACIKDSTNALFRGDWMQWRSYEWDACDVCFM